MSNKTKLESFGAPFTATEGYNAMITGRHVLVTESMKDYALEKLSKLERFSPRLIDVIVTMDIQKLEHRVELVMRFNNMKIKSHAVTGDMYASIDLAVDKLQNQIRRYKNKIQDHHLRALNVVDMNVNVIRPHRDDDLNEVNGEIEEENARNLIDQYRPHQVVSKEVKSLKTLSLDEAIMKMELSGDIFLIYRSEEDQKVKVIYVRKDGDFGVIEPEC